MLCDNAKSTHAPGMFSPTINEEKWICRRQPSIFNAIYKQTSLRFRRQKDHCFRQLKSDLQAWTQIIENAVLETLWFFFFKRKIQNRQTVKLEKEINVTSQARRKANTHSKAAAVDASKG